MSALPVGGESPAGKHRGSGPRRGPRRGRVASDSDNDPAKKFGGLKGRLSRLTVIVKKC